jgi:predicted PurR-regulated permease PerM
MVGTIQEYRRQEAGRFSRYAESMLGIEPRAARAAWTVFLVALLVAAAYAIRETLAVFMIALLFAYLLLPLVGLVERFTPRRISPRLALAIVYLALLGAIVALTFTIGTRIVEEANNLATRLPDLLKNREWIARIPLPTLLEPIRARISDMFQMELDNGGQEILPYVKTLGGQIVSGAKYVVYFVLVPIVAFFFLKDGREIQQNAVQSLTQGRQTLMVEEILEDINRLLGQYIRALVLLSLTSFIAHSLFLVATGAPYAVLLAVVAGLGEFLPVVGPAASGIVILLVTGLSGYEHSLWFVLFWILFRMFQDYAASPYLMGKGVELNPVLVLFGVLAGERIAGVAGMFFSVPVIATLRVVFVRLQRARSSAELVGPRE